MNIVYGGSFNPPTKAHLEIIEYLLDNFNAQNIIILPVGNKYEKDGLACFLDRYNMLKIMFKNHDVIISDIEKDKFLGTYISLKKLEEEYDELYFCMGADNFINLDKWRNNEKLLNEYRFIIFNRDKVDLNYYIENKYKKYKDKFILIEMDKKISSTDIRKNPDNYKELTTKDVYNYIKDNNLYKEE